MYKLEASYYEDEVREGFFIPSVMKKAWAANLIVLDEVHRICEKYNLKYYAAYGTLLGAVRHGGYIPWDDDLDIMMTRADFERFKEVAAKELQDGFTLLNVENTEDFWYFLTRVATGKHMRFEEEYLEKMHGFSYITGLDIFVLDTLATDAQEEKKRDVIINYTLAVADNLQEKEKPDLGDIEKIRQIQKITGKIVDINLSAKELRKELYRIALEYCSFFENNKDGKLARLMPDILEKKKSGWPREYFKDTINIPFEGGHIMAPAMYNKVLISIYSDYSNIIKDQADHNYPFFETQKAEFEAVWGNRFPEYTFSQELYDRQKTGSYKIFITEYLVEMRKILNDCRAEMLADAQAMAIEIGNFIDDTRPNCKSIVHILEVFCEKLYLLFTQLEKEEDDESLIGAMKNQVLDTFEDATKEIDKLILSRKEIIFLPFNAKHWKKFEKKYNEEISNPENDVYVMPIPYYYKKYDGTLVGEVFDVKEYPDKLNIIDYKNYDWENRHPDRVYIQYPYDAWNSETVIEKRFFSDYLWFFTDELIYVPYFRTADFDKNCKSEYYNMKYYCTMPAVVNSDKVILSSEKLKKVYIDKLTEFTKEEYREYWNNKIIVEEERDVKENKERKCVLYFVSFGHLYEYNEIMINKMNNTLQVILQNNDELDFVVRLDPITEINFNILNEETRNAYFGILEQIRAKKNIRIIQTEDGITDDELIEMCDAYYGTPSYLANRFMAEKKKVMIEDITIR